MAGEAEPPKAADEQKTVNATARSLDISLRKSIIANGDEVTSLTFREPTAADIERVGNPVTIDPFVIPYKITFDTKVMTQMMSVLATVPPSSIRLMHPKDWNNAAWLIADFFIPDL